MHPYIIKVRIRMDLSQLYVTYGGAMSNHRLTLIPNFLLGHHTNSGTT